MQATWVTDIHLNFLSANSRRDFYEEITLAGSQCLFITGDIGEAHCTEDLLLEMQEAIQMPIYFVAGNHDYYKGSIRAMRDKFIGEHLREKNIFFLTQMVSIRLGRDTSLLGVDGFADGRYGDFHKSHVVLNDSHLIKEFKWASGIGYYSQDKYGLIAEMQKWARKDAAALYMKLIHAEVQKVRNIIIMTHVPPYEECCLYKGERSNDDFLPFYTCKRIGQVIDKFADKHPEIKFLVLCGHTHDVCDYLRKPNLRVMVGGAQYNLPEIQCEIEIE